MNLENKIRSFLNPQVDESTYPGLGRSSESESPMQGSSEKPHINQLIKGAGSDASIKAGSATTLSAKSSPMDKTNPKQGSSKDPSIEQLDKDAPGKTASAKMKKAPSVTNQGAGKAPGYSTVADPRSVVGQSSSKGNVYQEEEEYDVDDLITEEEYDALSDEEKAEYDEVELVEDFDDEEMYEIDEDDLITEEEFDSLSDEEKAEYDEVELVEGGNVESRKGKHNFVRRVGSIFGGGKTGVALGTHPDELKRIGRDVLRKASSETQRKMRREDVESMDEANAANKAAKNAFVNKVGQKTKGLATVAGATTITAGRAMMRPQPHGSKIDNRVYKKSGKDSYWKSKGIDTGVHKEDLDRDMSTLFSEENNLSEEFMTKAASLFEAAVIARVEHQVQILEEIFADAVVETVTEIEEELTDKVDAYLSYVAEQWLAQNELAVVESLRTEITEDFISGLKNLFAENFIDVPDEKYDMVGEMADSIEMLQASVNEQMEVAIALNSELIELKRASVLAWVTEGLALTEAEKFASLVEDVSFEDESSFAEKLAVLKNNYFPNAPITESFDSDESESDSLVESDSSVLKYAKAISRTTFSK